MTKTLLERRYIRRRLLGKWLAPVRSVSGAAHPIGVAYRVTTPYATRGTSWALGYHTGEDYACPAGSVAVALTWGTVVEVGPVSWGPAYGTAVVIRTASGKYDYGYCHLTRAAVTVGQKVRPGTVVGYTGDTGNTKGFHLHFEARVAGGRYGSDVAPRKVRRLLK